MIRRVALRDDVLRACVDVWPDDFVLYALACERGDIGYLPETMSAYRLHASNAWAAKDAAERDAGVLQAFWFLGAHLRGPLQAAVQARLLTLIVESDGSQPHPAIAALRAEREAAAKRLEAVAAQLERLRAAQNELDALRRSRSWRLTAPLRGLRRLP
jgi:hypothetical protein